MIWTTNAVAALVLIDGDPVLRPVFVSTKPAELLHTLGQPAYRTESSSGLMYIENTDSQLLYDPVGRAAYLLMSDRRFVSRPGLTGPWS